MLLNCFAQPILLSNRKSCLSYDEFKNAPLLLCHKNALDEKLLPMGWSGNVYATQEILSEVQNQYTIKAASTKTLYPNEIYSINLATDGQCQYKSKNIEIVAIPWDTEYVIYLIKDDTVVNLLTDIITEDMTVFVQNKILRSSIKAGIDVLYINDGCYHHKSIELNEFPSECLLGALVTLVRPRYIQGLLSEMPLPQHIINCCVGLRGQ